jgi:hypothetical protein
MAPHTLAEGKVQEDRFQGEVEKSRFLEGC